MVWLWSRIKFFGINSPNDYFTFFIIDEKIFFQFLPLLIYFGVLLQVRILLYVCCNFFVQMGAGGHRFAACFYSCSCCCIINGTACSRMYKKSKIRQSLSQCVESILFCVSSAFTSSSLRLVVGRGSWICACGISCVSTKYPIQCSSRFSVCVHRYLSHFSDMPKIWNKNTSDVVTFCICIHMECTKSALAGRRHFSYFMLR